MTKHKKILPNEREMNQPNDLVIFYARNCGFDVIDNIVRLSIGEGNDKRTYEYNADDKSIKRQDSHGRVYFNEKNISNRDNETMHLLYELRKLYLKKSEQPYVTALEQGTCFFRYRSGKESEPKIQLLEEKLKSVGRVIEIFDKQTDNYGSSFGQQMDNCVNLLNIFIQNRTRCTECEFEEQVSLVHTEFDLELFKKEHQPFVACALQSLRAETFTKSQFSEFKELRSSSSDSFVGDFLRNIELVSLNLQKRQIEKELNKTKIIDSQIREKEEQLKFLRGNVRKGCQMSETEEQRFKNLLKAQGKRTNYLCKNGQLKMKEQSKNSALKRKLRHCPFNIAKEREDVSTLLTVVNREFQKEEKTKIDCIKNNKELVLRNEHNLPLLKEEVDLVTVMRRKLRNERTKLCEEINKQQRDKIRADRDIQVIHGTIIGWVEQVKRQYDQLRTHVIKIEELKENVKNLSTQKDAVKDEEMAIFQQNIFELAGGRPKVNPDDKYHNHDDCTKLVAEGGPGCCRYKMATDNTITFAREQMEKGIKSLNESALFQRLSGYRHSADFGKGKHAKALISAGEEAFRQYHKVEKKIRQRENELQIRIDEKKREQKEEEDKRDRLCNEIVCRDNEINAKKIYLLNAEEEERKISGEMRRNEKVKDNLEKFDEKLEEKQSRIQEKLDIEQAKRDDTVNDIVADVSNYNLHEFISSQKDFIDKQTYCEARLISGQITTFLINISALPSLEHVKKEVNLQKYELTERLKDCKNSEYEAITELKNIENSIKKVKGKFEKTLKQEHDMVFKRSRLEKQYPLDLINSINVNSLEITSLEKEGRTEMSKLEKKKNEFVKRHIFKNISDERKGITCLIDAETPDDVGDTNRLFRKRKFKGCQYLYDKARLLGCDYFDAVERMIKILLENSNEGFDRFLDSSTPHCKEKHKFDLKREWEIVLTVLSQFDTKIENVKQWYEREIDRHDIEKREKYGILRERKKLDGNLIIKREGIDESEEVVEKHIDADIIFFYNSRVIYTKLRQPIRFTLNAFLNKIDGQVLRTEMTILLNAAKSADISNMSMGRPSDRRMLYAYLADRFDKKFCKKTDEVVLCLNTLQELEITKSKLKFQISNMIREREQIERQQIVFDTLLKEIEQLQNTEPNQCKQQEANDLNMFNVMEKVCISLNKIRCEQISKMECDIDNFTEKIQNVKQHTPDHRKLIKPSVEFYKRLKQRILNSRLRIGLDRKTCCHRQCMDESCDYHSVVGELIDYYYDHINSSHDTLIQQFLINKNHLKDRHKRHLKDVLQIIVAEIQEEKYIRIAENREKIAALEWTKYFKKAQIQNEKDVIIVQLEKILGDIQKYTEFRTEASFLDECSEKESDVADMELEDYKRETFDISYKHQVTTLLNCYEALQTVQEKEIFTSNIFNVLKDFFSHLKRKEVVAYLKQEVILCTTVETSLKKLLRQKSGAFNADKYLLSLVSERCKYETVYNVNLDPLKMFHNSQIADRQNQLKDALKSVEILEKELSELKMKRIELKLEDNAPLREELENINICIGRIEDFNQISWLKKATVESNVCLENKDDYYSFDLAGRRVCVRLLGDEFSSKSTQMKKIDDIRTKNSKHEENLLEKKVFHENVCRELIKERDKQKKRNFFEIQRVLFVKGVVLCGYDSFSNDILLEDIDSSIAAITAHLLGESPYYQRGGLNETSQSVEDWTRVMRARFDGSFEAASYEAFLNNKGIEFVANELNAEFSSDNLKIKQINTPTKTYSFSDSEQLGKCVTLIHVDGKIYFLQKRDHNPDSDAKIANILFILRIDEALFQNLALKRLQNHHKINLQESSTLQDDYNLAISSLSNIRRLKDFNCFICNISASSDSHSLDVSLFSYLMHLEELDSTHGNEIQTVELCKIVKDLYKKGLRKVFAEEKERRRRKNEDGFVEASREETLIMEMINDKEQDMDELSNEIFCVEQNIEKETDNINGVLLEKEKIRALVKEKREILSNAIRNTYEQIREKQNKIRTINEEQLQSAKSLTDGQAEVARLEIQINEIEKEIETKKATKRALEKELLELEQQDKDLRAELMRVNKAKERKEKELVEKSKEIEASECFTKFLDNLSSIVATKEFYENKHDILNSVYANCVALNSLLSTLKTKLMKIQSENTTLWNTLIDGINYEMLEAEILQGKEIAGESQHESLGRLLAVFRCGLNTECDLITDSSCGKQIRKFKVVATNISSKDIEEKIKSSLEKEISRNENSGGLRFVDDILRCENYGVTGIGELSTNLQDFMKRKIELKSKSEEVQTKKSGKWKNASDIINSLKITYKELMKLYIDEIEVIASGTFFLNESMIYPGIDITIGARNMECVGDNLIIDTSGPNGETFVQHASGGISKRHNKNQPRGDKGHDGFDGSHGGNAGNIVIKVENLIKNLEGLKSIKANGGNGAEGQLGGDGDKGMKGANGKDGKASDTTWFGSSQTTIGFGSPGEPGGKGGECGDSGRPGEGGAAGVINVIHKGNQITCGERNPGRTAKNVLDHTRPKGGEGGDPGLYGMDEVKEKKGFFSKTKTLQTVVDRDRFIRDHPQYKNNVIDGGNVKNEDTWKGLLLSAAGGGAVGGAVGGVVGGIARGLLRGGVVGGLGGLAVGAVVGAVCYKFRDKSIKYNEAEESEQYRDRDLNRNDKQGQKNDTDAKLRNDTRIQQQQKRDAVNSDTLNAKMDEKTYSDEEMSGVKGLTEQISEFVLEREQMEFEIANYVQNAANIESEIENVKLASVTKVSEIEKLQEELASLERRETNLNALRIASIDQVLRALQKSQNLRDEKEKTELKLNELMELIQNYQQLQKDIHSNQNDHFKIFDDYIDALRGNLQRLRHYLKLLKADYNQKSIDMKNLKSKYEEIRSTRVNHTEIETELEEEVEQEAEIQLEQEITKEIEFDEKDKIPVPCPQVDPLAKSNVIFKMDSLRVKTLQDLRILLNDTPLFATGGKLENHVKDVIMFFEDPKMFFSNTMSDAKLVQKALTAILTTITSENPKKLDHKDVFLNTFQIFSKFYKILYAVSSNSPNNKLKSLDTNPLKQLTLKLISKAIHSNLNANIVVDYLKL